MFVPNAYWWLIVPGLLLGLYAQFKVTSTYRRFMKEPSSRGLTGARAARTILDDAGLRDVPVEEVPGELTDHYDPVQRKLCLSSDNFHGATVAAVGVSAHEAGHALQHQASYAFLKIRMALVPATQIASNAAIWISFAGFFLGFAKIAWLGIIIFGVVTLFQMITLPVEFDASRRAKEQLFRLGLVTNDEHAGVSRVLSAAALTYVAAMVSSLLTLLQFVLLARGDDRE